MKKKKKLIYDICEVVSSYGLHDNYSGKVRVTETGATEIIALVTEANRVAAKDGICSLKEHDIFEENVIYNNALNDVSDAIDKAIESLKKVEK